MASIRGSDTKPELLLRRALWRAGVRGWPCHLRGPGGRIDIAFTRWRLAVLVDGSFWHGHPSKWQPGAGRATGTPRSSATSRETPHGIKALGTRTPAGKRLAESLAFFEFLQQEMPAMLTRWQRQRPKPSR